MSKFCGNCGQQMNDNALVCGYCGTPLSSTGSIGPKPMDPERKKKVQGLIKKAIIAAIVIVILSISAGVVSSFVGYKGAVKKVMNAYKNENPAAMADMSCSFMQYDDYADIIENKYESILKNDYDTFDYHFNTNYTIKYKIISKSKMSDRQAKNFVEDLSYYGYFSEDDIYNVKKVMTVRVIITAKHGSDKSSMTRMIYLAKESGGWKLLDFTYN